jgi:hypothetical protein
MAHGQYDCPIYELCLCTQLVKIAVGMMLAFIAKITYFNMHWNKNDIQF